jgi:hypothetical protein
MKNCPSLLLNDLRGGWYTYFTGVLGYSVPDLFLVLFPVSLGFVGEDVVGSTRLSRINRPIENRYDRATRKATPEALSPISGIICPSRELGFDR